MLRRFFHWLSWNVEPQLEQADEELERQLSTLTESLRRERDHVWIKRGEQRRRHAPDRRAGERRRAS